jgi:hypothetical protein
LLEDDEQILVHTCLVCTRQFNPEKAMGFLSRGEEPPSEKAYHICEECVSKLGVAVAQSWLSSAVKRAERSASSVGEDPINSDTLSDVLQEPPLKTAAQERTRISKKEPESR